MADLSQAHGREGATEGARRADGPRTTTTGKRLRLPTASLWRALLFMSPLLLLLIVFKYLPMASAFWSSTRLYLAAGQPVGSAGLDNYVAIFRDAAFRDSLLRTLAFVALKVPLQLAVGLAAALLVSRTSRFNTFVRSSVFLPTVTAIVVVAVMFSFLFDRELGVVNGVLDAAGLPRVDWLFEPHTAQLVILLLSVWRDAGFVMLVFLAGLQAVPLSVLEAARIDGAGTWQELRHVTVPLLSRSFQFAVVFSTLAVVQLVAPILVMTSGGPRNATDLASYHAYEEAFRFFDWGTTSAMSVVLLALLVVLTFAELRLLRSRWEY